MAHKYKGRDRRLMEKAVLALALCWKRDVRAQNPKKTSQISTRDLMFPQTDVVLWDAFHAVQDRLELLLTLTT